MKNILLISCVFPPEPIVSAQLSLDIATELSKNNSVTVISPTPSRPYMFNFENKDITSSFSHIVVDSFTSPQSKIVDRLRESLSFGIECVKYIRNNKDNIDKIYLNSWPLFSQYLIVKEAKKYGIPSIVHVMDIYPESFTNKITLGSCIVQKVFLPMDKYILSNADKVVCISENMKQHLSNTRCLPLFKFYIVTNWQDENTFINYRNSNLKETEKSGPFTFMYLGNNGPVAGVEFLIQSFVSAGIENSQLIIAGGGSRTDWCKELVNSLWATNVKFMPVPDGKVPEIQDKADVLLLPVKKGGALSSIPSKLPAYMFSSKPIIGSLDKESDTAKAIVDADCGIVTEPENGSELVDAMKEMALWNRSLLDEKGKNGFNYAIENFSKGRNLKKIVRIITTNND